MSSTRSRSETFCWDRAVRFGPNIYWEDRQYFESTRGLVRIRLRTRKAESTGWEERAWLSVNAVPSKLGEQRYDTLVNEIRSVAAGLIFDVVSKMFRGVRYARGLAKVASRSSHLELGNLHRLWRDLSGPLDRIVTNPYLRIGRSIRPLSYNGAGVLDANAAARLAARGFAPRNRNQPWPVTISGQVLTRNGGHGRAPPDPVVPGAAAASSRGVYRDCAEAHRAHQERSPSPGCFRRSRADGL